MHIFIILKSLHYCPMTPRITLSPSIVSWYFDLLFEGDAVYQESIYQYLYDLHSHLDEHAEQKLISNILGWIALFFNFFSNVSWYFALFFEWGLVYQESINQDLQSTEYSTHWCAQPFAWVCRGRIGATIWNLIKPETFFVLHYQLKAKNLEYRFKCVFVYCCFKNYLSIRNVLI